MRSDGQADYAKKAAAIWASEDDLDASDSRAAIADYHVSEMRKLLFTFICVVAAVVQ